MGGIYLTLDLSLNKKKGLLLLLLDRSTRLKKQLFVNLFSAFDLCQRS